MAKRQTNPDWSRRWLQLVFFLAIGGVIASIIGTILYWSAIRPYYVKKQRTEITLERMGRAYDWLLEQAEKSQAFPPAQPTQRIIRKNPNGTGYDGWSKAIRYLPRETYVELRSAGSDGEMFSEDDITINSKQRPASFGARQKTE